MFLNEVQLAELMNRLNIDPQLPHTDDQIEHDFPSKIALCYFRLKENSPKIFDYLKERKHILPYVVSNYAVIETVAPGVFDYFQHIEEDFIYSFPRTELLGLAPYVVATLKNIMTEYGDYFLDAFDFISTNDSDRKPHLWEDLYEKFLEDESLIEAGLRQLRLFTVALEQAIILNEKGETLYKTLVAQGELESSALKESRCYVREEIKGVLDDFL